MNRGQKQTSDRITLEFSVSGCSDATGSIPRSHAVQHPERLPRGQTAGEKHARLALRQGAKLIIHYHYYRSITFSFYLPINFLSSVEHIILKDVKRVLNAVPHVLKAKKVEKVATR